jgi:hypothetical protein
LTLDALPGTGRLLHHCAVLAGADVIKGLGLYSSSLIATEPFPPAHQTLQSIWKWAETANSLNFSPHVPGEFALAFVKAQRSLYRKITSALDEPDVEGNIEICLSLAAEPISNQTFENRWRMTSAYMGYTCVASILGFGLKGGLFRAYTSKEISDPGVDDISADSMTLEDNPKALENARDCALEDAFGFSMGIFRKFLDMDDPRVNPFIHVILVFLQRLFILDLEENHARVRKQMLQAMPMDTLRQYLDSKRREADGKFWELELQDWLQQLEPGVFPLPEDFQIRHQIWSLEYRDGKAVPYFTDDWYQQSSDVDFREDTFFWNQRSNDMRRGARILWLGSKFLQRCDKLL